MTVCLIKCNGDRNVRPSPVTSRAVHDSLWIKKGPTVALMAKARMLMCLTPVNEMPRQGDVALVKAVQSYAMPTQN